MMDYSLGCAESVEKFIDQLVEDSDGRGVVVWEHSHNMYDSYDEANYQVFKKEVEKRFPDDFVEDEYRYYDKIIVKAWDENHEPTDAIKWVYATYQDLAGYPLLDEEVHSNLVYENQQWWHEEYGSSDPWPGASSWVEVEEEIENWSDNDHGYGHDDTFFRTLDELRGEILAILLQDTNHKRLYDELIDYNSSIKTGAQLREWVRDQQLDTDFKVYRAEQGANRFWNLPERTRYIEYTDNEDGWSPSSQSVEIITQCLRDVITEAKLKEREGHIVRISIGQYNYETDIS